MITNRSAGGDPARGFEYLYYGDYIAAGTPLKALGLPEPADDDTATLNAFKKTIGPTQNVFRDANGVWVVSGSCFTCHAIVRDGKLEPGLGNPFADWSQKNTTNFEEKRAKIAEFLGESSIEYQSFFESWRYQKAFVPKIVAECAGLNPAFRIEEAAAAFRYPDLTYSEKSVLAIKDTLPVPVSDIPPLWNVKKKKRLYYNGQGTGDFRKLLMQAGMIGIRDTIEAKKIWQKFADVAAWIESLQAPKWPYVIDQELAEVGKDYFERECRKCHGSYGWDGEYPNKIIPLKRIETDPYYAEYWKTMSEFPKWFNQSWFGLSEPSAQLMPEEGYVAPPLDGVWASAPYFHNGSVPNLAAALNSSLRPKLWDRDLQHPEYDSIRVGWQYEKIAEPRGSSTYDTRRRGYSNQGHTFGDGLSEEERRAILEYLKTL
ncbi:hypothetical protein HUU42_03235 [bacterium]|nr:hypothetical protein [bacterium]